MDLPDRITRAWMDALIDADLLSAESRLRETFFALERVQKAALGAKYDMMKGSNELLTAWDRWARVDNATRARGLHPRRKP
ncbi:MAG: hypothetical protein M3373_01355 [Gemmatimonadota bacterium]|nr:hypothetical protein [Gemmatimonadota bacterium]